MNNSAKWSLFSLSVIDPGYHEKGQFFTVTQGQVLHDPKRAVTVSSSPRPPRNNSLDFLGSWDRLAGTKDLTAGQQSRCC